jgi:predicted RNA binding protein YcfA (HicA-like mRNA interferase family)
VPKKIRQLIKELEQAGFLNRGGKGGHRNFIHPKGVALTISGNLGDDAKHYQEKEVVKKIRESQK